MYIRSRIVLSLFAAIEKMSTLHSCGLSPRYCDVVLFLETAARRRTSETEFVQMNRIRMRIFSVIVECTLDLREVHF